MQESLPASLLKRFLATRAASVELCRPLAHDDYQVQSADYVSPPKWHLAHTSWFFETFILTRFDPQYRSIDERYARLFNSYYESLGTTVHNRLRRGHLSRPTLEEVFAYRSFVDEHIAALAAKLQNEDFARLLDLGINHEEQHQELLYMDIKHILFMNPMQPVFSQNAGPPPAQSGTAPLRWIEMTAGMHQIGARRDEFSFDNEGPQHAVHVGNFAIADRPVSKGEYLAFMNDGGYDDPLLWLSDGWATAKAEEWKAPLYWSYENGIWKEFTLRGSQPVALDEPVCHVSYYEALAYAHWRGARLPTEYEWEVAARSGAMKTGEVWEWTQSAYCAYPGYRVSRDALGEYNGKFMVNQMVLRGGALLTPPGHARPSYRNFYHPQMRWQFSGLRLVEDR